MRRVRAAADEVQQGACMDQEGVGGAKCARSTNRLNADARRGPRNPTSLGNWAKILQENR